MPRPKTKQELIDLSKDNYEKLLEFVNSLTPEQRTEEFPPPTMNRNIRDVLMHLHHWHEMLMKWYEVGMKGEKPAMPAEGYSWKTVPELNKWIWEKYQKTTLEQALALLQESFSSIQSIIKKHSEEELFQKKRYKWTGSTSLAAYLISATSSHYDWALKLIKKAKK